MMTRMTIAWLTLAWLCGAALAEDSWKYIVPAPDDPFANPPPRALALSDEKPADLKESVKYRGDKRRYAQLVYGTGRTAKVAIVVDFVATDKVDLYVDADRDWDITAKDRVEGEGLTWRVHLKTVVAEGGGSREFPRTVVVRYGRASRTLSVATCGYVEGRTSLNGEMVSVRRVDGDANGLFADAKDRIWIDRNGNGVWDSFNEEFLFAPILRLGEERFAVRADARGEQLSFARLEGTGKLRLRLPAAIKPDQVEDIQATVQSRDGVVANLRRLDAPVTVPAGSYRFSSLLLTLKHAKGGPSWGFIFNDNGGKGHHWHDLKKDAELALDPIGTLDFAAELNDGKPSCRAGSRIDVRPALYTGDGLLIERAYRGVFVSGSFGGGCSGHIKLISPDERKLDSAVSGFA
jgi:hypothetical protein